jgi:hypothetical protein
MVDAGLSAKAAAGDLADYFRYRFNTGHRPENLAERQLSDFLWGRTRPLCAARNYAQVQLQIAPKRSSAVGWAGDYLRIVKRMQHLHHGTRRGIVAQVHD